MRVRDIDFDNVLLDEESYKTYGNIYICNISYKHFMSAKLLSVWFGKIVGFIKIFDGIRYLVLLGSKQYDAIYNRTRYLITQKSGITDIINHNFARIMIDSYNFLPVEETLTFHNVIIFIKLVVNKNENNYYCNIFLEKGSYEDRFNTQCFK